MIQRRRFLGRSVALVTGLSQISGTLPDIGSGSAVISTEPGFSNTAPSQPQALKKGDVIAITCPAGFIMAEEILPAQRILESWGFKVRLGSTVGRKDFSFGGTDEERTRDMQIMLDDPSVKAIMCARGGYGVSRMMDKLSFTRLKDRPKWIIGFSDITALHLHLERHLPIVSLHSKMCNSFPENWETAEPVVQETIHSIRQALTGTKMTYKAAADALNRPGVGEGLLVGGNLSIIIHLMGTESEINTQGKILFLEETGEYLYSLDRMLTQLKRAGKLEKLAGLIIGGFRIKPDDPGEEFGRDLYAIVREKTQSYKYPVCFNFPVGHQKNNFALKCGARHVLTVRKDGVELVEKKAYDNA